MKRELFAALALMAAAVPLEAAVEFPTGRSAYVVAAPESALARRTVAELADYAAQVLHAPSRVVPTLDQVPAGEPAMILAEQAAPDFPDVRPPEGSPEAFALQTSDRAGHAVAVAVGATAAGLKRAMQRLVLRSEQRAPGLVLPDCRFSERPWIERREWSEPSWSPDFVRGVWHNPNADERVNLWRYSPDQLARYVAMLDWLGYNGGELHDTVIAYANVGSPETVTDRLRAQARDLKALGDHVTVWVWASQFHGYGWVDGDVVDTPAPGLTAFTDPKVRAGFERYYDRYAQLAPEADLVVAHFYDPGTLQRRADVFSYLGLLRDKFRAANPRVQLAVDSWYSGSEQDYMRELVAHGFGDVLFLENTMPHTYPAGKREALHAAAKAAGLPLGIWGWHTVEKETDQDANMYVNAELLSRLYRQIRDGAARIDPISYWSEMEAYHLVNIFSHYAAAQLLWNPDRDPDELLKEIAFALWGPRNGPALLDALRLIQDARSGPTWETYWGHAALNANNPAGIVRRADASIAAFEALRIDPGFVPKLPLPFPPETWRELILPHLRQIRAYAAFRLELGKLQADARRGVPAAELEREARAAWVPVPEYSNWIGMFGPVEDRLQEQAILPFARAHGFKLVPPGYLRWRDADRLREAVVNAQREHAEPFRFSLDAWMVNRAFGWSAEKGRDRAQLLIDQGVLVRSGDRFQLADWEEHRLR